MTNEFLLKMEVINGVTIENIYKIMLAFY